MAVSKRRPSILRRAIVATGVLLLVAGCAGEGGETASSSSSAAPTSQAEEPATTEELTAALLPAEAFGPNANVVTISVEEISRTTGGLPPGATVQPESCARFAGSAQLSPDDFGAIVAQSATSPEAVTVEVLAESEEIDRAVPRLDDVPAECRQITVTAPDGSAATVTLAPLDVPSLGESSAGVSLTMALRRPDGSSITVPSLMAVAVDGGRMLLLQQVSPRAAPLDEAAFTALFEEAFEAAQAG